MLGESRIALRYAGPFGWQPNNSTRQFEYPWAFDQISRLGSGLAITELGGGVSGLQYVLAREGHRVVNVDPGQGAGWSLDSSLHRRLGKALGAQVALIPSTLSQAELPAASQDVVVSVSALEHFSDEAIAELCREVPRVLKPGGALVLTVDLFPDLHPFTSVPAHETGRNIDLRKLIDDCGLTLTTGTTAELYGFPDFDPQAVQSRLGDLLIGAYYPTLTQALVARLG
jgi:SAM-dependent methyltransferase